MNPRFKGLGKVIFLVPLLLTILLRMIFGDEESSNRAIYLCAIMNLTGIITFGIAVAQDKKTGIDPFSRKAWTSELLESEHIFLHLPLRLVGLLALLVSPLFFVF